MVKLNYEGGLTLDGIGFVESDYMILIAWYLELIYKSIDFFGFWSHKTIDDVFFYGQLGPTCQFGSVQVILI